MIQSKNYLVLKYVLFLLVLVLFASCDKDYNTLGSEIIDGENFNLSKSEIELSATNHDLGPVQSNNLPVNPLGIFVNSNSETTTANFVTQVALTDFKSKFDLGLNPVIDSVVLYVPYFNTKTGFKEDNVTGKYELDSIYGKSGVKLNLSVYESGYFLSSIDSALEAQSYYSNQDNDFNSAKRGARLNDSSDKSQNDEFVFSNLEIKDSIHGKTDKSINRLAPGMRINLNKEFFKNKFFTTAFTESIKSENDFNNYFRGLYFKVENSGSNDASMAMLNFKGGKITVYFHQQTSDKKDVDYKTFDVNLTGNSVSLLKNSASKPVDPRDLKLKGGEGSMVVLNVFNPEDLIGYDKNGKLTGPNGVSDELDDLRASKILINDATLTVFVDKSVVGNDANLPNRLYLYDVDNGKELIDYNYDSSVRAYRKYDKYVHGGILNTTNGSYKIKLTYHMRNLINDEKVKNVRLGLVISEDINNITKKKLKTPININSKLISEVPTSSVMSPFETVIFGNTPGIDSDKKLKLEIYYTKPN